ncbi:MULTISPECIES: competence protein CoiA family protein [Kitasatospora]|uniref:Competence protein CoiA nuclease-like domain-containing protein n=1 Tax=Kitasatospora cystarginea TaxID=58350 RepID=A0ABP5RIT2_9ACTN
MANGVFHTGYGIEINLTLPDLGHPERPGLLEEITQPVAQRDRELLECLEHRDGGVCRSELADKSPWMAIRTVRRNGRPILRAAHLPVTHSATPEESAKRKAMKERIARAAVRAGLAVETEVRSESGSRVSDVLVTGPGGRRIGWEAQYSPISSETVRRRSRIAADGGITPLWVTASDAATLIDRAPWARVDDVPWQLIDSPYEMAVRGGVRHFQAWKCTVTSERTCPLRNGAHCGEFHFGWELPALCVPPRPATSIDRLVVASAEGEFVAVRVPDQCDPHKSMRMWVSSADRDTWWEIVGPPLSEERQDGTAVDEEITFTHEEIDRSCRYGEETLAFNRPRPRGGDASLVHTFPEVPEFLRPVEAAPRLRITDRERKSAAQRLRCPVWEIGPCDLCSAPIRRYGTFCGVTCRPCRMKAAARTA